MINLMLKQFHTDKAVRFKNRGSLFINSQMHFRFVSSVPPVGMVLCETRTCKISHERKRKRRIVKYGSRERECVRERDIVGYWHQISSLDVKELLVSAVGLVLYDGMLPSKPRHTLLLFQIIHLPRIELEADHIS